MRRLKRMLIVTVVSIIAVCGILTVKSSANGTELDNLKKGNNATTVHAKYTDLTDRDDLFCVQSGVTFRNVEENFTVKGHLKINGNSIGNYSDRSNAVMAYILNQAVASGGYGKVGAYTSGQLALYRYYNTWSTNVSKTEYRNYIIAPFRSNAVVKINNEAQNIIDNANTYADSIGESSRVQVTDKTDKSDIKVKAYESGSTTYVKVGTFQWNFSGKIEDIKVYSNKNKVINNIKYTKIEGNNEKTVKPTNIKSGDKFYLNIKLNDIDYESISKIVIKINGQEIKLYNADIWFLYHATRQNLILVQPSQETQPGNGQITLNYNIVLKKTIKIEKVDESNEQIKLSGVKFILKNKNLGKYVKKKDGDIYYVSKSRATQFETNSDGIIKVKGLVNGTYVAHETENPNKDYILNTEGKTIPQEKTKKVITNRRKDTDNSTTGSTYIPYDKDERLSISGFVWLDNIYGKKSVRNDLYKGDSYDTNDQAFNGITVRLKEKNGNIARDENGNQLVTTTSERGLYSQINGGEYIFSNILAYRLPNLYVEFEYDGLIYQSVVVNNNSSNGSKATDKKERTILDENFKSVNATGYNSVNVNNKYTVNYTETKDHVANIKNDNCTIHANTKDSNYKLEDHYSKGVTEIRNVNLGVYRKEQADIALGQDLETVNLGLNGFWHLYKYGSRDYTRNDSWNVGVRFQNKYTGTYRRAVYKADVEYQNSDKSNELQVYLTYKIALKNESSYITKVNSVIQYFDTRYSIVAAGTGLDSNNNITGHANIGNVTTYNNNYKKCIIDFDTKVNPGYAKYVYVQFKLDRNAVVQILNKKETLYAVAEINSYTTYKDDKDNTVAVVDKDAVPGNTRPTEVTTFEDDTEASPPIILELTAARETEGTVFVDATSGKLKTGQARQGNGIYDNGEKTIQGVKVTLHEINNATEDKVTTTDANGYYKFTGYIPGKYVIIYTWGDKTYTVQNYKSTVYKDKNRLNRIDANNNPWYKDTTPRYSDAMDYYDTRKAIDAEMVAVVDHTLNDQIKDLYNGGNNHPGLTRTKMNSLTPTMEFSVEYNTNITDGTGNEMKFIVRNVDFGIAERPRQQLDMIKRVKAFKLTLANGQVIADCTIDENGKVNGTTKYLTYMAPTVTNGYNFNGAIKAELDSELIEGAKVEITYSIEITNNGEMDYLSENFYQYGEINGNVITVTPTAVVDYLDNNLGIDPDANKQWTQIDTSKLKQLKAMKMDDAEFLNVRSIFYTEATKKALKPTEKVAVELKSSKVLSSSGETTFNNDAELVIAEKPNGTDDKTQQRGNSLNYFPVDKAEQVEVTPSTGENRAFIIVGITTLVAAIILGVGVYYIKKRAV